MAKFFATFVLVCFAGSMIVVFQNCGSGMEVAASNSVLYNSVSSVCIGVNCQQDLSTAIFKSSTPNIYVDSGTYTTACNSANCFDVAGYCETGGYPASMFTYQWTLAGQTPQAEVVSGVSCDSNGRFSIQIHVPAQFDWSQMHTLRVVMKVIDSGGAQLVNPSGAAAFNFVVAGR
jgi:hypothetical protein